MVSVSLSGFALCCVALMVTSPLLTGATSEIPLTATPSNNSARAGGVNVTSSFPPPKIDPTPCISKGPLQFTVSMPGVAADDMKKNYNVKYVLNHNTDPDAPWVEYDYHPIMLSEPGKHSIDLQATVTDVSDPRKGDVSSSRFQCVILDPIVYDITACPKCHGKPTVGQPFSIWVQYADRESSMFLTTQSNGCETQKHLVDGTAIRFKITRKPMVTFVPEGVGTSVYVCLRDGPNGPYKLIPRLNGLDRFELQGAAGGMTPMPDSADGGSQPQPDFDEDGDYLNY